jgi:hypothetical protein
LLCHAEATAMRAACVQMCYAIERTPVWPTPAAVTRLHLYGNAIGNAGAAALAALLQVRTHLCMCVFVVMVFVWPCAVQLNTDGVAAAAVKRQGRRAGVERLRRRTSVFLVCTHIVPEPVYGGSNSCGPSLQVNTTLTDFDISTQYPPIGAEGHAALLAALQVW